MATERERKLVIAILKERVEKQTGKKVIFVENPISKEKPTQQKIRDFLIQNPGATRRQILQDLFGISPEDIKKGYNYSKTHIIENTLQRALSSGLIKVDNTVKPMKWYAVENEILEEGNPVTHKLPSSIDSFLQDIAQYTELIHYKDIMNIDPSKFNVNEAAKLIKAVNLKVANYDLSDEEIAELSEVKKVIMMVKEAAKLETVLQEKKKTANKMTIDKDDYIKAIKKADRELEKDTNTGFKRGQTAHKSEKDYSRKIKHKNNFQIDEDRRGDATFEDILKIQRKQLDEWKQLLQPHVYEALEKWATEKNDQKKSPYDIIRGTNLDNFIGNYLKGYTPQN